MDVHTGRVDDLGEQVKTMGNAVKKVKKNIKAADSGSSYLTHFAVVILVTLGIVSVLLFVCNGEEIDPKILKKMKKEKVEEDLVPLSKPTLNDDGYDDESCITTRQGSQGHLRKPVGAY